MDEEQTKLCPNCKREIPSTNFTIHSVHCARNIGVCPVCKEPVPLADLQKHHDELHKQLPCKQCGDSVCGTDLEDHIRDSCAQTIKTCRFCELELPRRELPPHENYCGVRTEQCPDCREWVMIKYRQLHLDSNHGFIRLDDDPPPASRLLPRLPSTRPSAGPANGAARVSIFDNYVKNINLGTGDCESAGPVPGGSGAKAPFKRKNDQPQINTTVETTNKVWKDLSISRGAVKKRPAPAPPARAAPPPAPPYLCAVQRQQRELADREEQNAINFAAGLPPVSSAAARVDKLRALDALLNRENNNVELRNRDPRPRPPAACAPPAPCAPPGVKNTNSFLSHNISPKHLNFAQTSAPRLEKQLNVSRNTPGPPSGDAGHSGAPLNINPLSAGRGRGPTSNGFASNVPAATHKVSNVTQTIPTAAAGPSCPVPGTARYVPGATSNGSLTIKNTNLTGNDPLEVERRRQEFQDLKPMTPEEFMERFKRFRMRDEENATKGEDRMSEIKSSLRELRRELNEVTAPYNAPPAPPGLGGAAPPSPPRSPPLSPPDDVELPCEFCAAPVPMNQLVLHQTGCRPDLAQLVRRAPVRAEPRRDEPVIPCEFCTESLPVYLISEHQERCGRDADLMYPD
ncbi:uncharacterized protein LOC101739743 [Bombyx mori]|uniref:TRAF-type domain-containing protein n=1 Tax=Bombyx mori TaxID=7091 RepID=A0A8R2AUX7_BOMMO|nr:verprolin [Bombyx mori]